MYEHYLQTGKTEHFKFWSRKLCGLVTGFLNCEDLSLTNAFSASQDTPGSPVSTGSLSLLQQPLAVPV